jgi:hypothetical protein
MVGFQVTTTTTIIVTFIPSQIIPLPPSSYPRDGRNQRLEHGRVKYPKVNV